MEKELENRLSKIGEDIGIIKVSVQEGFKETGEKLAKVDELRSSSRFANARVLEARINETYNAVDGFIKIVTKLENEFAAMKADLKRVKKVIKEKLGVDLF